MSNVVDIRFARARHLARVKAERVRELAEGFSVALNPEEEAAYFVQQGWCDEDDARLALEALGEVWSA